MRLARRADQAHDSGECVDGVVVSRIRESGEFLDECGVLAQEVDSAVLNLWADAEESARLVTVWYYRNRWDVYRGIHGIALTFDLLLKCPLIRHGFDTDAREVVFEVALDDCLDLTVERHALLAEHIEHPNSPVLVHANHEDDEIVRLGGGRDSKVGVSVLGKVRRRGARFVKLEPRHFDHGGLVVRWLVHVLLSECDAPDFLLELHELLHRPPDTLAVLDSLPEDAPVGLVEIEHLALVIEYRTDELEESHLAVHGRDDDVVNPSVELLAAFRGAHKLVILGIVDDDFRWALVLDVHTTTLARASRDDVDVV